DDVLQLMASIARIDSQVQLRERIDRGDVVFNYGLQVVYRNQGNAQLPVNPQLVTGSSSTSFGVQPPAPEQVPQSTPLGALTATPDLWAKLYYKALTVEVEAVGVLGRVNHPGPLAADDQRMTLAQLGWVAAAELRLYHDSFFVGLET